MVITLQACHSLGGACQSGFSGSYADLISNIRSDVSSENDAKIFSCVDVMRRADVGRVKFVHINSVYRLAIADKSIIRIYV